MRRLFTCALVVCAAAAMWGAQDPHDSRVFTTSEECLACHNGLRAPSGEDVSIGTSWSTSMMANASRDPYWQAAVRREVLDHPSAASAIQDECATCHMPMSRTEARMAGADGEVFAHLAPGDDTRAAKLAHDGVGCAMCHQITGQNLGTRSSFTGGYVVSPPDARTPRPMFGPFRIERGVTRIMRSATGFEPTESPHVRQSELCATCHTLITKALGANGEVIGELPEQMPFLEWKHSAYASQERSCQSCHMPVVDEDTPIASVLGAPRKGFARHTFVGGNFFMQRMLGRFRSDLGVVAPSSDLNAAADATVANLRSRTARLTLERVERAGARLVAEIKVETETGHKLPTGYPSRRVWLHVTLRDRAGRVVFESGAVDARGAIAGNDNDADPMGVEPHYDEIRDPGQVQIYESVMRDQENKPTTGLLKAIGFSKDNRLLPQGFDKSGADEWISVVGGAAQDSNFVGGGDRIRYHIDLGEAEGPFELEVELRFQVIAFRWAENLRPYQSEETRRFVTFYESMASSSSEVLASARGGVP